MFRIRKIVASVIAATTMIVGVGALNVGALSKSVVSTSGPTNKISITTEGYTSFYSPVGGVYVYTYGVRSYTNGYNDDLVDALTNFTISGNLHNGSSSTPFSKSASNVEICDYSQTTGTDYDYCSSTVSTSSTIYGTSTQVCNFAC